VSSILRDMSPVLVRRTYLALRTPSPAGPPTPAPAGDVRVERLDRCPVARYRALYAGVGGPHQWRDRLAWSDERLDAWLARPEVHVSVLRVAGADAGYFELVEHGRGDVELAYFGLFPSVLGRGLGRYLLERAIAESAALGARPLWLHTCSLDGPAALPNYLARGFVPFRSVEYPAAG
jgi:GNAT superfamily N-acetyltransferase